MLEPSHRRQRQIAYILRTIARLLFRMFSMFWTKSRRGLIPNLRSSTTRAWNDTIHHPLQTPCMHLYSSPHCNNNTKRKSATNSQSKCNQQIIQ
jgi:hypothetical protein